MGGLPDPDWYFEHVLYWAEPGRPAVAAGASAQWQAWWRGHAMVDDPVLRRAARQGFVLGRHELTALGIGESAVRTALRHERWTRARYGAVAPIEMHTDLPRSGAASHLTRRRHAVQCAAAALRRVDHVVSGRSAAILHGLPTLNVPTTPELTAPDPARLGRRSRTHVYGASLTSDMIGSWFGVPVTLVARTLVDLARHDRRDALMAADAALRERLVQHTEIATALGRARGWPGIRQARAVLELADPLAESPLESVLRLALHDHGFPPPELQFWIGRDRVDMYWPQYRLVVEADGRGKYTDDELWAEKKREVRLRSQGNRIERVVWSDVMSDWPATRARLWSVLAG